MLFASVPKPQLLKNLETVDGIELRLDLYPWSRKEIKETLEKHCCILTLRRSHPQERFREEEIEELLKLAPPFFDIEFQMRKEFILRVIERYPKTKFILSYHNFERTPVDLESIYQKMCAYRVFGYKIATLTQSTNDALRMILFSKKYQNLSAICMGEKGAFARVLGAVFGNQIDYCAISEGASVAPGQLTAYEMIHRYRYRTLNCKTGIYGLIGDPVEKSEGHIYHNEGFRKSNRDAIYVKIPLTPLELPGFFSLAQEFGFRGLSVTMPLKEQILKYLDEMDETVKKCQASNTLLFSSSKIFGTNTDGSGALDAIEKKIRVEKKIIVILGAGGAARAIASVAKERGALVFIFNRTFQKAEKLASDLGLQIGFPKHYDILVRSTPSSVEFDPKWILPKKVVMDITYCPKETPFLSHAKEKGCQIVYGEEMFRNQAELQTKYWFS